MIEEFQEHFDGHDLQVLNMQHESADWEARLKTIETEVEFLQKLLNEELIKELSENSGKNTTFSEIKSGVFSLSLNLTLWSEWDSK